MKYHFVYLTKRVGTPYYYYGVHSTNNLDDGYLGSGDYLKNAIRKYGKENFSREILSFFDTREQALKYENKLITKEMINDKYCYNIQHGGKGTKEEHLLSTKQKMSIKAKGRKLSQEQINKIIETRKRNIERKGYFHTEESKRKIGAASKGNKYALNLKHSEETKRKMSNSQKKRYKNNPELKERQSMLRKEYLKENPIVISQEQRNIISKAQKERFKDPEERKRTSIDTKKGMEKSEKWKTYKEDLKSHKREGSMKGKKNPNFGQSMKYAMHIRWHIKRNIINKECEYCVPK